MLGADTAAGKPSVSPMMPPPGGASTEPRGKVGSIFARRGRPRPLQQLELEVTVAGKATTALVDSGATHCFISAAFVDAAQLGTTRAVRPLFVTLANGLELVASHVATVGIEFPRMQLS